MKPPGRRSRLAIALGAVLAAGCGHPPAADRVLRDLRTAYPSALLVSAVSREGNWEHTTMQIRFRLPADTTILEVDYGYRLVNHAWTLVARDTTAVPSGSAEPGRP